MGDIDRRRANGNRRAPTESCRTCVLRDEQQYQSLVRLAALLTGDAELAETVTADALVAGPCSTARRHSSELCLAFLQQQVVARSRLRRYRLAPERRGPAAPPAGFAQLPVVAALRSLSPHVREAVVLTYYLDLPAGEAAAIAGISESALRANLAAAMNALDDEAAGPWPGS